MQNNLTGALIHWVVGREKMMDARRLEKLHCWHWTPENVVWRRQTPLWIQTPDTSKISVWTLDAYKNTPQDPRRQTYSHPETNYFLLSPLDILKLIFYLFLHDEAIPLWRIFEIFDSLKAGNSHCLEPWTIELFWYLSYLDFHLVVYRCHRESIPLFMFKLAKRERQRET